MWSDLKADTLQNNPQASDWSPQTNQNDCSGRILTLTRRQCWWMSECSLLCGVFLGGTNSELDYLLSLLPMTAAADGVGLLIPACSNKPNQLHATHMPLWVKTASPCRREEWMWKLKKFIGLINRHFSLSVTAHFHICWSLPIFVFSDFPKLLADLKHDGHGPAGARRMCADMKAKADTWWTIWHMTRKNTSNLNTWFARFHLDLNKI